MKPAGNPRRLNNRSVQYGCGGKIVFPENKGRNARWEMIQREIFGNLTKAAALTSVANLTWKNVSDSTLLADKQLKQGAPTVFRLIKQSKPRVIVALCKAAWKPLVELFQSKGLILSRSCQSSLNHIVIRVPECDFNTLVLRSPQHPSRHFFNKEKAKEIGSLVRLFIKTDKD